MMPSPFRVTRAYPVVRVEVRGVNVRLHVSAGGAATAWFPSTRCGCVWLDQLFGFYHVHQPWGIVESAIGGVFFLAYPSWRLRSTWMGVVVHSAQSVFFAFLVLGVVLGVA